MLFTICLAAPEPAPSRLLQMLNLSGSGPQFLAVTLGIAFLLGAAHALTPGHGKTIVAAYLVGSRGTIWDAVYLGSVVTLTHTSELQSQSNLVCRLLLEKKKSYRTGVQLFC